MMPIAITIKKWSGVLEFYVLIRACFIYIEAVSYWRWKAEYPTFGKQLNMFIKCMTHEHILGENNVKNYKTIVLYFAFQSSVNTMRYFITKKVKYVWNPGKSTYEKLR